MLRVAPVPGPRQKETRQRGATAFENSFFLATTFENARADFERANPPQRGDRPREGAVRPAERGTPSLFLSSDSEGKRGAAKSRHRFAPEPQPPDRNAPSRGASSAPVPRG